MAQDKYYEERKGIYDFMSKSYNMGDEDTFMKHFEDPEERKRIYDFMSKTYNMGDFDTFNKHMGYGSDATGAGEQASAAVNQVQNNIIGEDDGYTVHEATPREMDSINASVNTPERQADQNSVQIAQHMAQPYDASKNYYKPLDTDVPTFVEFRDAYDLEKRELEANIAAGMPLSYREYNDKVNDLSYAQHPGMMMADPDNMTDEEYAVEYGRTNGNAFRLMWGDKISPATVALNGKGITFDQESQLRSLMQSAQEAYSNQNADYGKALETYQTAANSILGEGGAEKFNAYIQGNVLEDIESDLDKKISENAASLENAKKEYQDSLKNKKQEKKSFIERWLSGTSMSGVGGVGAITGTSEEVSDWSKYEIAQKLLNDSKKHITEYNLEQKDMEGQGELAKEYLPSASSFGRGLKDVVTSMSTWDFGLSDAWTYDSLLKVVNKSENNEKLSAADQALLDAAAMKMAVEMNARLNGSYSAGEIIGEMVPFAIEIALNPLSGAGETVASKVARYALKKQMGKFAMKSLSGLARLATDATLGGVGQALTTGELKTMSAIDQRMIGDIQYNVDADGRIVYDGVEGREDATEAFWKGLASQSIEYQSELVGEYFKPLSRMLGKSMRAPLYKAVGKDYYRNLYGTMIGVGEGALPKTVSSIRETFKTVGDKTKFDGWLGETAEEIVGGLENYMFGTSDQALLNGTENNPGILSFDNISETALMMLPAQIMFALLPIGAGVTNTAVSASSARYREITANSNASSLLGKDRWTEIKKQVNAADGSDLVDVVKAVVNDDTMSMDQKRAIAHYVIARQVRKGTDMARGVQMNHNINQMVYGNQYDKGMNMNNPSEVSDWCALNAHDLQALRDSGIENFGSWVKAIKANPVEAIERMYRNAKDYRGTVHITADQIAAAEQFASSCQVVQGAMDRLSTESLQKRTDFEADVNASTHKDGQMHPVQLMDGRTAYVINGNVNALQDGSVDRDNSDGVVICYVDGKQEAVGVTNIQSVQALQDPKKAVSAFAADLDNANATSWKNLYEGTVGPQIGNKVDLLVGDGVEQVTVVDQDPTNGAWIVQREDGNQYAVSQDYLQQSADYARGERVGLMINDRMGVASQQGAEEEAPVEAPEEVAEETVPEEAPEVSEPVAGPEMVTLQWHDNEGKVHTGKGYFDGRDNYWHIKDDADGKDVMIDVTDEDLQIVDQPEAAPVESVTSSTEVPTVAETADEAVPLDKNQNPIWHKITPERAAKWLTTESGLELDEALEYAKKMFADAYDTKVKLDNTEVEMGDDLNKYQKDKNKLEVSRSVADSKFAYWESVISNMKTMQAESYQNLQKSVAQEAADKAHQRRSRMTPAKRIAAIEQAGMSSEYPTSAVEAVLWKIASGQMKLTKESILNEVGSNHSITDDGYRSKSRTAQKGGLTIPRLAESLAEDSEGRLDEGELRDAIIEYMSLSREEALTELEKMSGVWAADEMAGSAAIDEALMAADEHAIEEAPAEEPEDAGNVFGAGYVGSGMDDAAPTDVPFSITDANEQNTQNVDEVLGMAEWQDRIRKLENVFGITIATGDGFGPGENGTYDRRTKTITINRNLPINRAIGWVIGHELTHRMKDISGGYEAYLDSVAEYWGMDTFMQLVNDRIKLYAQNNVKLNMSTAMEEVAADFGGSLLNDGRLMADYMRKSDLKGLARLAETMKDIVSRIRKILKEGGLSEIDRSVIAMENFIKGAQKGSAEEMAGPVVRNTGTENDTVDETTENAVGDESEVEPAAAASIAHSYSAWIDNAKRDTRNAVRNFENDSYQLIASMNVDGKKVTESNMFDTLYQIGSYYNRERAKLMESLDMLIEYSRDGMKRGAYGSAVMGNRMVIDAFADSDIVGYSHAYDENTFEDVQEPVYGDMFYKAQQEILKPLTESYIKAMRQLSGDRTGQKYIDSKVSTFERELSKVNSLADDNKENSGADYGDDVRYSIVTDENATPYDLQVRQEIADGKVQTVYRSMQVVEIDGRRYALPPMASKIDGKWVQGVEILDDGRLEPVLLRADEHPELAKNGKFYLDKGNGKGLWAAYNPYWHVSPKTEGSSGMLNDQFAEAQDRNNLITVEGVVPISELESGYKADKAKDAVGAHDWKAGIIAGQLTGTRRVILSRYFQGMRVVPDAEVAQNIYNDINGNVEVMPSNVVPVGVRAELEKLGVKFVETDNMNQLKDGEHAGDRYTWWFGKNQEKNRRKAFREKAISEYMHLADWLEKEGRTGQIDAKYVAKTDKTIDVAIEKQKAEDANKAEADVKNAEKKASKKKSGKNVRHSFSSTKFDFIRNRELAIRENGIVMPGLNETDVVVVHSDGKFDFEGMRPSEWATKNLVTESVNNGKTVYDENLPRLKDGTEYSISKKAIGKFFSSSASKKYDGYDSESHIQALPKLKEIISNSIDVEIHPDFIDKDESGKRNPKGRINKERIIHRMYGAFEYNNKIYRVKVTMHEFFNNDIKPRPHSYEVAKIELLDESSSSDRAEGGINVASLSGAKLLKNVEKEHDKGVKVLDASEKYYSLLSELDNNNNEESRKSITVEDGTNLLDEISNSEATDQESDEAVFDQNDIRHSILKEDDLKNLGQAYFNKYYVEDRKKRDRLAPLSRTGMTQELLDACNAAISDAVDMMKPYLDAVHEGKRYLPEEVYGMSTIFDNSSYGKTVENTLICFRTLAYNDFCDELKRRLGRPLTVRESFLASQMLYDIATEPQCLYCYVSLDRKAYDEYLLNYMKDRDEVISKFNAMENKSHKNIMKLYTEFLAGRKDTPNMKLRFASWLQIAENGNGITNADLATEEQRSQIKHDNEEPSGWEEIQRKYNRLKGAEKRAYRDSQEYQRALIMHMASKGGQVQDAEAYAQSASWAKKPAQYRSYTGELLKASASGLKGVMGQYGLRFYSFSEYSPAFIVENMQQVRDAALRGMKTFAYTKKTDFARIFATTGMNINVSTFGRVDSNGNVVMDTNQGADWNEVKALREKYPNVAAVFVATNDDMVNWALDQDWIDVIIPFHIVRTGQSVADFYKWINYTSESADYDINGRHADIYPHEHHNDKDTYMKLVQERGITPRFARFVDHPNYMRLVNETRRSADETPLTLPVFDMEAAEASWNQFVDDGGYYSNYFVSDEAFEEGIQRVKSDIEAGREANEVDYGRQDMPIDFAERLSKIRNKHRSHGNTPLVRNSFDPDQIKTPAFKNWFGDWENDPENASKVVNKDGTPMVVHHGTSSYGFTVFNTSAEWNGANVGSHFGGGDIAREFGNDGQVYNVYLDIKKPWETFDWFADIYDNAYLDALSGLVKEIGTPEARDMMLDGIKRIYTYADPAELEKAMDESFMDIFPDDEGLFENGDVGAHVDNEVFRDKTVQLIRDIMNLGGYDGIKYENWYEHSDGDANQTCWIVLEPNQIKSADTEGAMANNGEFDPGNPDIRYSISPDEQFGMVGIHNISAANLRKAMRLGGLVNPSVAVVDMEIQPHTSYGEISLMLPSSLVDARTGRNLGTYDRDAYTPMVPKLEYHAGKDTSRKVDELVSVVSNKQLRDRISEYVRHHVDVDWDARGFAYLYALENGFAPENILYKSQNNGMTYDELESYVGKPLTIDGFIDYKVYDAFTPEERLELNRMKLKSQTGMNDEQLQKFIEEKPFMKLLYNKDMSENAWRAWVNSLQFDKTTAGRIDVDATLQSAMDAVDQRGERELMEAWKDEKIADLGYEAMIFDHWSRNGDRVYKKATLDNLSKYMNKQGKNGSEGHWKGSGFMLSKAAQNFKTLKEIRKNHYRLTSHGDEMHDKISEEITEAQRKFIEAMGGKYLDATTDAVAFDFASDILINGMSPDAVARKFNDDKWNKKDGYHISFSEEEKKWFEDLRKSIHELPVFYFETKFARPVQLKEFAAAIIPDNVDNALKDALKNSGLEVRTYKAGDNADRVDVTKKIVSERDDISFSITDDAAAMNLYDHMDKSQRMGVADEAAGMNWNFPEAVRRYVSKHEDDFDRAIVTDTDNGMSFEDALKMASSEEDDSDIRYSFSMNTPEDQQRTQLEDEINRQQRELTKLRAEVAKLKDRKQKVSEAKAKARTLIDQMLTPEAGMHMTSTQIQGLISAINLAETSSDIDRALENVGNIITRSQLKAELVRMQTYLKSKTQTQTKRGVAKGVLVDSMTAQVLEEVRGTYKSLLITSIDGTLKQLRSEINAMGTEIKRLRDAGDNAAADDLEQKQNALKTDRDNFQKMREEILLSNAGQTISDLEQMEEGVNTRIDDLIAEGKEVSQDLMQQKLALPIRIKLAQLRQMMTETGQLDRDRNQKAYEAQNSGNWQERENLKDESYRCGVEADLNRRSMARLAREIADDLKDLLDEGRSKRSEMLQEEIEHRKKIIRMGIDAVEKNPVRSILQPVTKEEETEAERKKRQASFNATALSFNHMMKVIDVNHPGGDGPLYEYIMKGEHGAVSSNDALSDGLKQFASRVDEACQKFFGKSLKQVMKENRDVVDDVDISVKVMSNNNEQDKDQRTVTHLSRAQALYVWLTWRQIQGKVKLERMGFDELSMDAIESIIGPDMMEFGKWVTDEYLVELRDDKYNPVHERVMGTPMHKAAHYFPIKILGLARVDKDEIGERSPEGAMGSLAGNTVVRTENSLPIDISTDAFECLLEYGNNMERYAAMADLQRDLNILRGCKAFRNLMEANDPGSFIRWKEAAQLCVGTYKGQTGGDYSEFWGKIQSGFMQQAIGFRWYTALKQTLSYPAFWAYSGNLKYQAKVHRYFFTPAANYKWAEQTLPGFRERIAKGDMGIEGLNDKTFLDAITGKFSQWGMAANKLVDALTVAAGARAVYEYDLERYIAQGMPEDEARRQATINAEIAFNESQQSSRPEFSSPTQKNKDLLSRCMNAFQNSNISYRRQIIEGWMDISRAQDMYDRGKISKEDKSNMVWRGIRKMVTFAVILPGLWQLGIDPSIFFGRGGDDDEDWKSRQLNWWIDMAAAILEGMFLNGRNGGMFMVSQAEKIKTKLLKSDGGRVNEYDPLQGFKIMSDCVNDVLKDVDNEDYLGIVKDVALRTGQTAGVNVETFSNMALGVWDAIEQKDPSLLDAMLILNMPKSKRTDYVARRYYNIDFNELANRMSRAMGYWHDYENLDESSQKKVDKKL